MCIQWCCKNCPGKPAKLTHRWARERCNEYFIARSQNLETAGCPVGPWELRRAYHRHPYRGPQICDDCRDIGRKDKKQVQLARHKANTALGLRPAYNGAMEVGELEIPDTFHGDPYGVFEKGKVGDDLSGWEIFKGAKVHPPAHGFELDWADRSAAFNEGGPHGKGRTRQPSKLTSSFRKRGSGEKDDPVNTTLVGDGSRNQHQQSHHHTASSAHGQNEDNTPCATRREPRSTVNRPDMTTAEQTVPRCAIKFANYKHNISDTNTHTCMEKQNPPTVEEASHSATHHHEHHQYSDKIYSPLSNRNDHSAPVDNRATPQGSNGSHHYSTSTATALSPPSHSIRRRPWDL